MSRHLSDLLDDLKERVARMGAMVQQVVEQAVESVLTADARLAQRTIEADARIDEEDVRVERAAIDLLALHQPAASDLRLVTSVIKVNGELERIGDCAVNAAQRVPPLSGQGRTPDPPADLKLMGEKVIATLRDAIKSFNQADPDLARHVLRGDDVVDALYHQIVQDMLSQVEADGQKAAAHLAYIMIA